MRTLPINLFALFCLVSTLLCAGPVAADSGAPLEGLTDVEKAYVNGLKASYADARQSLGRLKNTIGSEAFGALFGVEASPTEVAGAVVSCAGELDSIAPGFQAAPPASMETLAEANQSVAAVLTTAFDPCVALTVDEGVQHVLDAGRNLLSGLLGAAPAEDEQQKTSFKARIIACVSSEIGRVEGALDAGESQLDAVVAEIQLAQQMGEDFLEAFLSGECFIATAAYGTKSAVQIDILRAFRDEVLMTSVTGRDLVGFYYAASPPLAAYIERHDYARWTVRECLVDPAVWVIERLSPAWQS